MMVRPSQPPCATRHSLLAIRPSREVLHDQRQSHRIAQHRAGGARICTQSAAFYSHVWGLEPVGADGDTIQLRGNGTEHHVVTLRERPKPGLLGVHFAATDRDAVMRCTRKAKAFGRHRDLGEPADLPRERRRRLRLPVPHARGPRAQRLVRRGAPSERGQRPLQADQAVPCGAQQRQASSEQTSRSSSTCSASSSAIPPR